MPRTRDRYETMTVAELREEARGRVPGFSRMGKGELVEALAQPRGRGGAKAGGRGSSRPVSDTRATRYAQKVGKPGEHEEREGRTLATTDHEVIRRWAEERRARPATIRGTEHGDRLGVLRFDFPGGDSGGDLVPVSWDDWSATFDQRNLNFIYQEHRADGRQSNFFRLDNPDREDG